MLGQTKLEGFFQIGTILDLKKCLNLGVFTVYHKCKASCHFSGFNFSFLQRSASGRGFSGFWACQRGTLGSFIFMVWFMKFIELTESDSTLMHYWTALCWNKKIEKIVRIRFQNMLSLYEPWKFVLWILLQHSLIAEKRFETKYYIHFSI